MQEIILKTNCSPYMFTTFDKESNSRLWVIRLTKKDVAAFTVGNSAIPNEKVAENGTITHYTFTITILRT